MKMEKCLIMIILMLFMIGCTNSEKVEIKKEMKVEIKKEIKKDIGPYKEKLFLLGDMNNWKKSTKFRYMGNNTYLAKLYLYEGSYRFNISNLKQDKTFLIDDGNQKSVVFEKEMKLKQINDNKKWNLISLDYTSRINIKVIIKENDLENPFLTIENIEEKTKLPENLDAKLEWRHEKAGIKIDQLENGNRKYTQYTTKKLRDNDPRDKKVEYEENKNQLLTRTGNIMFDGLFALAMDESKKNSVDEITDGSFNNGNPVKYKAFETGEKWHYVWTRDTAYSVNLALGMLDPTRSANSLLYKVSPKRVKTNENIKSGIEIVQDTGSGGSWPISTDRVTWALGAWETMKYLDGKSKEDFFETSYEAIINTIENDRISIYDSEDGLYRGEQSFLDWREQTYPLWTAKNTVHIGMSKSLSTNATHYAILKIASEMANTVGNKELSNKYGKWSSSLQKSINEEFWLSEKGLYGSMKTTELDDFVSSKYDLLGEALTIILGIADKEKAKLIVENYPQSEAGPSVIWPQILDIPTYHNRGMWPFVTAYFLKSAKIAQNDAVVTHDILSMYRSSALNLSNMENYEFLSGSHTYNDYLNEEGPVINSKRQLWSVAGYISMVTDIIFGLEANQEEIRFNPFITKSIKKEFFENSKKINLKNFKYKGKMIDIEIDFPEILKSEKGYYVVEKVILNEKNIEKSWINLDMLKEKNSLKIILKEETDDVIKKGNINIIDIENYKTIWGKDMRKVFMPREAKISEIKKVEKGLELLIEPSLEENTVFNIYKNGKLYKKGLKSNTWIDENYKLTENNEKTVFSVENGKLKSNSSEIKERKDKKYLSKWGKFDDKFEINEVKVTNTTKYDIKIVYANAYNSVNTGITCATKWVEVKSENGEIIKKGIIYMPQLPSWNIWGNSSLFSVNLKKGENYKIEISDYYNMSYFKHFDIYNGEGGVEGPLNKADIAEIIIEPRGDNYSVEVEYVDSNNKSHHSIPKKVY